MKLKNRFVLLDLWKICRYSWLDIDYASLKEIIIHANTLYRNFMQSFLVIESYPCLAIPSRISLKAKMQAREMLFVSMNYTEMQHWNCCKKFVSSDALGDIQLAIYTPSNVTTLSNSHLLSKASLNAFTSSKFIKCPLFESPYGAVCILLTIKFCLMTFMDKIPFYQIFQKEWNFNNICIHKYFEVFEILAKNMLFFLWREVVH